MIIDFLSDAHLWIKSLHIISVTAWMAGLFYLPRLYVYHVEQTHIAGLAPVLETMERRLLRAIMNPAMIATWIFGICLVATPGVVDWSLLWPWLKAGAVIAMTVFHMWLSRQRKALMAGAATATGRDYRIMNEVPTILLVIIVFSVVVKF